MFKKIIVAALFLGMPFMANAGEFTTSNQVSLVDIAGDSQDITIIPEGNQWGAASCPTAGRVVIRSTLPSYNQFLATILTAQASGATIRFFGDCAPNPAFFVATLVRIQ